MKDQDFKVILDNDFLTDEEKNKINQLVFGNDINWNLNKETVSVDYYSYATISNKDTEEHFQFTHWLKHKSKEESRYYDYFYNNIFLKFLNKNNINHSEVIRAKLNLVTSFKEGVHQTAHVDLKYPHSVFLYYINDSDGDTVFFNEKYNGTKQELTVANKISPEIGKGIVFDGLTYHSPTAPNKYPYRAVLNIDFI